ncbi:MAG TPA: EamA family transporter [Xanthobacteraceae bacterium]|nr:EamA family transporter [Xanthobacteraceae bacterium]
MIKVAAGFAVIVGCTVGANLLMKIGANASAADRAATLPVHWQSVAGLMLFGVGGLTYAWVLQFVPLHVAQGIAAAQYMLVVLAAFVLLAEPISPARWVGVVLIFAGILLVSGAADGLSDRG